jgi:hypothetical protein
VSSPRPALITVGMYLSGVFGAMCLIGLLLAVLNFGDFSVADEKVSGPVFLRQAGLILAIGGLLSVGAAASIAAQRPWSRYVMLFFWVCGAVSAFAQAWAEASTVSVAAAPLAAIAVTIPAILPIPVAWWYLFRKKNVVAYYRSLQLAPGGAG